MIIFMNFRFTNMTREEAILALKAKNDPDLNLLAKWVAESVAFNQATYNARVALADAERHAEALVAGSPENKEEP